VAGQALDDVIARKRRLAFAVVDLGPLQARVEIQRQIDLAVLRDIAADERSIDLLDAVLHELLHQAALGRERAANTRLRWPRDPGDAPHASRLDRITRAAG
jgi:hypothetical protein